MVRKSIGGGYILKKSSLICKGKNNQIIMHGSGLLNRCCIQILGDNNVIEIHDDVLIVDGTLNIEDSGNRIEIGKHSRLCGSVSMGCIEGTTISIGENCLFSSDITIRTGDSHSILDEKGKRMNPSSDVVINDHVWVGHKVTLNKGVHIERDTVLGACSLVTESIPHSNVIIAGVPAKIIKENINWDIRRL